MNYLFYQFILYLPPRDVEDLIVFAVSTETFTNIKYIFKILRRQMDHTHKGKGWGENQ